MNILHVLSQFEVTGAEVYAATLINEQVRRNHMILVLSDTFSTPAQGTYIPMPIGNRSYLNRIANISKIVTLVRTHNIDLIHAHSRAASWVSYFAALCTGTPFVSTVHGRQHVHASSRSFSIYGHHIIAVSEYLKDHLVADLGLDACNIMVIPNGLESALWESKLKFPSRRRLFNQLDKTKVILFVGRLTGPKGDVVRSLVSGVMPIVARQVKSDLIVIGGEKRPEGFKELFDATESSSRTSGLLLLDFQRDITPYLYRADLIVGSGRVAIEALALGKQTLAYGESNYLGKITTKNFDEARKSNFGDTGIHAPADIHIVAGDIVKSLRRRPLNEEIDAVKKLSKKYFDIAVVEPQVESVYDCARLRVRIPNYIPVLMYHRVVREPAHDSRHGTWITLTQFEQHLRSLSNRGYTSITFRELEEFGKKENRLPTKPIILTFDDGYEDNYTNVFPLLKQYGATAVVFVVGDAKRRINYWDVDEPRLPLMSTKQMREMAQYRIEFGSHTISHSKLPSITREAAVREIAGSKRILERLLKREVMSFAYPYGALNEEVKEIVKESGYRFAVAGDSGPARFVEDLFEIRRVQVFPWTSPLGFWKKTQKWYTEYKATKQ